MQLIKQYSKTNLRERLLLLNKFNVLKQCSFCDDIAKYISDIVQYNKTHSQYKRMIVKMKCKLIYMVSFLYDNKLQYLKYNMYTNYDVVLKVVSKYSSKSFKLLYYMTLSKFNLMLQKNNWYQYYEYLPYLIKPIMSKKE